MLILNLPKNINHIQNLVKVLDFYSYLGFPL